MARKSSGKPWLHGASGWWCATIAGKRRKLDKDYTVACRKLKACFTQAKRGDGTVAGWLDATLSALADEYLDHIKATKKPGTYRSFRYGILRALRILGPQLRVGEMRKFHLARIEQEMAKGDYSPTTIKDTITLVQQVYNWAVEQELLDSNPVPKYRKPRARRRSRIISPDEFGVLLRHSDRAFRRFLIALRLTGCRPGELRSLVWEWVDLEQGLWIIPEHKTITRQREPRPRIIPLPRTVLMMCRWLARKPHKPCDHVFQNLHGRPYSMDCVVTKMGRIRERAQVGSKGGERIVLYSARHTYGTDGVGKVSDIELAELMGHTEARMTHRYVHLKVEHLQDIQRRVQGGH
jgi:integrase